MKKEIIRLTESDLHSMIQNAVYNILKEEDGKSDFSKKFFKKAKDAKNNPEENEKVVDFVKNNVNENFTQYDQAEASYNVEDKLDKAISANNVKEAENCADWLMTYGYWPYVSEYTREAYFDLKKKYEN